MVYEQVTKREMEVIFLFTVNEPSLREKNEFCIFQKWNIKSTTFFQTKSTVIHHPLIQSHAVNLYFISAQMSSSGNPFCLTRVLDIQTLHWPGPQVTNRGASRLTGVPGHILYHKSQRHSFVVVIEEMVCLDFQVLAGRHQNKTQNYLQMMKILIVIVVNIFLINLKCKRSDERFP